MRHFCKMKNQNESVGWIELLDSWSAIVSMSEMSGLYETILCEEIAGKS